MSKKALLLLSAAVSIMLPATSALGQQATTQTNASGANELNTGEIVVTARKRRESIMKVPVIETAVTGPVLDQFGSRDIKGLAALVPALKIGSSIEATGVQLTIRGIGTTATNTTSDQAVALNVDGLPLNQGLAYAAGMFDLAQIEVLEGPQALFYGKSATAGVISLRSNDPTDRTEFILRGSYEPIASQRRGEFILSGPVSSTLKMRLSASYSAEDGYFHNIGQGLPSTGSLNPRFGSVSHDNQLLLRGTVLWAPTSRLNFRLKLNYDKADVNGFDGNISPVSCPNGTEPLAGFPPFLNPNLPCAISRNLSFTDYDPAAFIGIRNGGTPFNNMWQAFATLETNYHVTDTIALTSITGYYKVNDKDLYGGSVYAATAFAYDNNFHQHNFSEELRANSTFSGPLNFSAGLFYQSGQSYEELGTLLNQTLLPFGQYGQHGYFLVDSHVISPYGQIRYKILPRLELAAGARWSHESKSLTEVNLLTGSPVVVPSSVPHTDSYHLNPEFTVTYTPTDDLTLYGSYKTAAKSGGFENLQIVGPGTDLSYKDETAKGGEIGLKAYLLDHRLRFTLDAYSYDYSNLQEGVVLSTDVGAVVKTINAGTSRTRGIEAAASYRPAFIEGLTLNGALNYNKAKFKVFNEAPCWGGQTIAQGCNRNFNTITQSFSSQSLSGRPLINAPVWTANFGFNYETSVFGTMMLAIGSNTTYSSSYYNDLPERSDMVQKAYLKTNLSVALRAQNEAWEVAVIGNNLSDKLTTGFCSNQGTRSSTLAAGQITGGTTSGPPGPDELTCGIETGRAVFLRLTLHPLDLFR